MLVIGFQTDYCRTLTASFSRNFPRLSHFVQLVPRLSIFSLVSPCLRTKIFYIFHIPVNHELGFDDIRVYLQSLVIVGEQPPLIALSLIH